MSGAIKVGDLVMIRGICCEKHAIHLGRIGTVTALSSANEFGCSGPKTGLIARVPKPTTREEMHGWFHCSWLKRIPPLEELDNVREEEKERA